METNKLNLIGSLELDNQQNDLDKFTNDFISELNSFISDKFDMDKNIDFNSFVEDDLALSEEDLNYNLDYYSDFDYKNLYYNYDR